MESASTPNDTNCNVGADEGHLFQPSRRAGVQQSAGPPPSGTAELGTSLDSQHTLTRHSRGNSDDNQAT
jgi:hypothetical protein